MRFLVIICFSLFVIGWADAQSDTLNRVDSDLKKTGYWIIYGKSKPSSGFVDTAIMEEGKYEAGKKIGLWKTYYSSGIKKSEIEYKNNRPNGWFTIYYERGNIKETGIWKGMFYIGEYRRYFENDCISQKKVFNKAGKSELSVYYYRSDTCELKDEEYFPNSKVKYIKYNRKGEVIKSDSLGVRSFGEKIYIGSEIKEEKEFIKLESKDSTKTKWLDQTSKYYDYDCKCYIKLTETDNGYKKLYNENKQISIDGELKKGKLYDGKYYVYDKNGLLDKIEIYKKGKYLGDAEID